MFKVKKDATPVWLRKTPVNVFANITNSVGKPSNACCYETSQ